MDFADQIFTDLRLLSVCSFAPRYTKFGPHKTYSLHLTHAFDLDPLPIPPAFSWLRATKRTIFLFGTEISRSQAPPLHHLSYATSQRPSITAQSSLGRGGLLEQKKRSTARNSLANLLDWRFTSLEPRAGGICALDLAGKWRRSVEEGRLSARGEKSDACSLPSPLSVDWWQEDSHRVDQTRLHWNSQSHARELVIRVERRGPNPPRSIAALVPKTENCSWGNKNNKDFRCNMPIM